MSNIIGSGVIEVSADSRKLTAGIDEAKRSLKSLGIAAEGATKGQSASIDRYIKSLGQMAVTAGKTGRELELYKLSLRGATAEQLKAADSALKMSDAYARGEVIGQRIRSGAIAIGAAAVIAGGAFTAMIASSINAVDNLNDLSKKTGVTVEDLSGLSYAAKLSGTDLEGLAGSVAKLSQNIGKDPEKYKALGISAKDPIEAFKQLADIFASIDDPQKQAALGAAALGKSWQSAAPALSEGGKAIGDMIDKGKRLSGVTKEMADEAAKFNDELDELSAVATGLGVKLAGEMLGPLSDITSAIKTAYVESGKLSAAWVALGSLGAFLFTDEFASATTKMSDLQFQLKTLEAKKANSDKSPGILRDLVFGSKNDLISEIEAVKSKIATLRDGMTPKPAAPPKPLSTLASTAGVNDFIKTPTGGGSSKATAATRAASDAAKEYAKTIKADIAGYLEMDSLRQKSILTTIEANEKLAKSYQDAQLEAASYLDTISKQAAREVQGLGKGAQFRSDQAGINAIEDKSSTRKESLGSDLRTDKITKDQYDKYLALANQTYDEELRIYTKARAQMTEVQGQWSIGADEAMNNYLDSSKNIYAQVGDLAGNALKGMEDALVSFVTTGKLSFSSLASSIVSDIARIIIKQQISNALGVAGSGGGFFGSIIGAITGGSSIAGGRAIGGPVSAGKTYRVNENGPELLNVAGKQYLMMGNQGGTVSPDSSKAGGSVVVNQSFTVGDVASVTMVRQAVANSQRQLVAALGRSSNYGGAIA